MDKPWKVILAFVGVFIAGAVFGGLFTLRSARRVAVEASNRPAQPLVMPTAPVTQPAPPTPDKPVPPPRNPITASLMRQFTQRLSLTGDQRKTIQPIVSRWGDDLQHVRKENERQQHLYLENVVRLSDRMYGDVAAVLTPEQRAQLDTMRREAQERAERERQKRAEAAAAKAKNPAAAPAKGPLDKLKTGGP